MKPPPFGPHPQPLSHRRGGQTANTRACGSSCASVSDMPTARQIRVRMMPPLLVGEGEGGEVNPQARIHSPAQAKRKAPGEPGASRERVVWRATER
jgi:hypothetical protein